jgi:hypothetical protein
MGFPFTAHNPSSLPTSLQGSNIGWLGISLSGDSRDVNCNRKSSQHQAHSCRVIFIEKSHSIGLKTYFFMHLQLQTTTIHENYGYLQAPILCSPMPSQNLHVKTTLFSHTNFLSPMQVDSHTLQC